MILDSHYGREENVTPERVAELLRNGKKEELWLGTGEQFPALAVLTSGNDANITYFLDEGAMWVSSGDDARSGEMLEVVINGTPDEVCAAFCVTLGDALACVRSFFDDMFTLPGCIEWDGI